MEEVLENWKEDWQKTPVQYAPDYSEAFVIETDASDKWIE